MIYSHRLSTIMNADRIIVVTGGELVERGSHDELIRAKGKYAELWSKQVFVKAQDKGSIEDRPAVKKQKTPNIVNDLPSEVAKLELAKVRSNSDSTDVEESANSSSSEDSVESSNTLVTPGHENEV